MDNNWFPPRKRTRHLPPDCETENIAPTGGSSPQSPATPVPPARIHAENAYQSLPTPRLTPRPPLIEKKNWPNRRNGFEVKPQHTSFKPYALNNPGKPRQQAFAVEEYEVLSAQPAVTAERWNVEAKSAGLLKVEDTLRDFQVQAANWVIGRKGDLCLIAPTGSGKSLVWALPLLLQKTGISLVIVPYTSLGYQGEGRFNKSNIKSTFLHSQRADWHVLEDIAKADKMHIIYACPEMLETPRVAKLLHAKSFRAQLSGIYIDEAHSVHESHTWRPAYAHLSHLRRVVGMDAPVVCISATLPTPYRNSLKAYAGLKDDYHLINLGNFRPELSTVIKKMDGDISSCSDLGFVVPWNATEDSIPSTLIYTDNIDRLTSMFRYFHNLLSTRGLPLSLLDAIHAGLSDEHQRKSTDSFTSGQTRILLATDKIGAGMDFPNVCRVVQYCCQDLTLVRWEQRRGRGGRRRGGTAVGIILVEKSMTGDDGRVSATSPGFEDPAIVDLVQTTSCLEQVTDYWLENPPRLNQVVPCGRCSNCNRELLQIFCSNLTWIMEDPSQSQSSNPNQLGAPTKEKQQEILAELKDWHLKVWEQHFQDEWAYYYGPRSFISDTDLEEIASHIHLIHNREHLFNYTHIIYFDIIAPLLLDFLSELKLRIYGPQLQDTQGTINAQISNDAPPFPDIPSTPMQSTWPSPQGAVMGPTTSTQVKPSHQSRNIRVKPCNLAPGEFVMQFNI